MLVTLNVSAFQICLEHIFMFHSWHLHTIYIVNKKVYDKAINLTFTNVCCP